MERMMQENKDRLAGCYDNLRRRDWTSLLSLSVFFFLLHLLCLFGFFFLRGRTSLPPPSESPSAIYTYFKNLLKWNIHKYSLRYSIYWSLSSMYIYSCMYETIFDEIYCECIYKGDFLSFCFSRILFCGLFLPIFFSVATSNPHFNPLFMLLPCFDSS